jgi:hypothetical protein
LRAEWAKIRDNSPVTTALQTLGNVQSAQEQLLKYLNTISNNRWLVLKVCAHVTVGGLVMWPWDAGCGN